MHFNVTDIAQYVRLENCDRYIRFRLYPQEREALVKDCKIPNEFEVKEQGLSPLLQSSGGLFEEEIETRLAAYLRTQGTDPATAITKLSPEDRKSKERAWQATQQWLQGLDDTPRYLVQARLEVAVGDVDCVGHPDILRGVRRNGNIHILVSDIKASRKDRVEHRIQVAVYIRMLEELLSGWGETDIALHGAVIRKPSPEDTPEESDALLRLSRGEPTFDKTPYILAVHQLMEEDDNTLSQITQAPSLDDIFFDLGYKCDGCLFNSYCMTDSGLRRDLSLIPTIKPTEKKLLYKHGIRDFVSLAQLKTLPSGSASRLQPVSGQESLASTLEKETGLGPRLDTLIQRARRLSSKYAQKTGAPPVRSRTFIYNSGFTRLPNPSVHGGMVQVFLDSQHDYLEDRIYLLAALVKGPKGERAVVKMSKHPPQEHDERQLLGDWLKQLFQSICDVAQSSNSYLHFYVYDRYDQRVLLDALRRHLEGISTMVPAVYDLLTQSEALDQDMVSFLADEIRLRQNVATTCLSLYLVAQNMGYKWDETLRTKFIHRVFDSYARETNKGIVLETASRYNSQIPLEYAYCAWLNAGTEEDESIWPSWSIGFFGLEGQDAEAKKQKLEEPLARFMKPSVKGRPTTMTRADVQEFAIERMKALAFLENRCVRRDIKWNQAKQPIHLPDVESSSGLVPPLARALEEFLYIEHHTKVQQLLADYARPCEERMQAGTALIVEHVEEVDGKKKHQKFRLRGDVIGFTADEVIERMKIDEGDWVVVTPIEDATKPWWVPSSWFGTIQSLDNCELVIDNIYLGKEKTFFKRTHAPPKFSPGDLCVIAPATDDANGDKLLAACKGAVENALYKRFEGDTGPPIQETTKRAEAAIRFLEDVIEVSGPYPPTETQSRIIAEHVVAPLLIVQGPPGTGKSHTLGWTVLSRLFAAQQANQPMRVFVCSKTHNAVNIVLKHVHHKWEQLQKHKPTNESHKSLEKIWVGKAAQSPDRWVDGLPHIPPGSPNKTVYKKELSVIGGTPSALFKIRRKVRETYPKGLFDLVVMDESSQMTLPEGLLASWFLKPEGQIIVVGDHRQLPPILAHPWENEDRRSSQEHNVYQSLFEFVKELAIYPREVLDVSFRFQRSHASFLDKHIYWEDFERDHENPKPGFKALKDEPEAKLVDKAWDDPFLAAVLDPQYPTVLIEHDEEESQQRNALEGNIVSRILEACEQAWGEDFQAGESIGVVVPHRLQRAILKKSHTRFEQDIDTVDRFQGSERNLVIVSATVSDPDAILAEEKFLLNPNRLNVSISRQKTKLIVIASRHIFRLLSSEVETFERAAIWKNLLSSMNIDVGRFDICGHEVQIKGIQPVI